MTSDAREIAARLTKAQRDVLQRLPRVYGRWWGPIDVLVANDLIDMARSTNPRGKSYDRGWWEPTVLGLAVRAELERQEQQK